MAEKTKAQMIVDLVAQGYDQDEMENLLKPQVAELWADEFDPPETPADTPADEPPAPPAEPTAPAGQYSQVVYASKFKRHLEICVERPEVEKNLRGEVTKRTAGKYVHVRGGHAQVLKDSPEHKALKAYAKKRPGRLWLDKVATREANLTPAQKAELDNL
jgi:hypothetical protein